MKSILFYNVVLFSFLNATSQRVVDVDKEPPRQGGALNYVYTVAGTPFVTAKFAKVVEGSPFFHDQMMYGAVILSEGKEYKNILVRLNLLESQVNYLGEKQVEMIATSPVREVVLWDTVNKIDHRFIFSSYIETTDKPEKAFYELLQNGKKELYKQYKKTIQETRPYGSATTEQTIRTEARYYILTGGQWKRVKKLKELISLLSDKKNEVERFIKEKQIEGDNESNFQAIVSYYNSLHIAQ